MKTLLRSVASVLSFALLVLPGCAVSSHPHVEASAGVVTRTNRLAAVVDQPGPITVETVTSVRWAVPREGLINLDHPKAKAAGLKEGDEPVDVYFHVLRHPMKGTYLVDTGMEKNLRDAPDKAAIRGFVGSFLHREKMTFLMPLGDYLAAHPEPLRGVFLTHAHLDHVGGLPDVPKDVPVYTGHGELDEHALMNIFVQGTTDRAFEGFAPSGEWRFAADPDGVFDGVVDVFGDETLFAVSVPGHSDGSTAYIARTPGGPVMLTGDACHTAWGWENGVEPGEFSSDRKRSAKSLEHLRAFAAAHPTMDVRLGHQKLAAR